MCILYGRQQLEDVKEGHWRSLCIRGVYPAVQLVVCIRGLCPAVQLVILRQLFSPKAHRGRSIISGLQLLMFVGDNEQYFPCIVYTWIRVLSR